MSKIDSTCVSKSATLDTNRILSKVIRVRLSESDYQKLLNDAAKLNLNISEYLRLLIKLPFGVKSDCSDEDTHLTILYDKDEFSELVKQIRTWGYHYNQAVRALNTINANPEMWADEVIELMHTASNELTEVNEQTNRISEKVDAIYNADRVHLGKRRRNRRRTVSK